MPSNEKSPDIKKPFNRQSNLWRYMDITKYLFLINYQKLFFCRADKLDDPYEGSFTENDRIRKDEWYLQLKKENKNLTEEMIFKMKEDEIKLMRNMQKDTFINCWNINEKESMAMWKIYGGEKKSIAIQSNYELLHQCLPDKITTGVVEYIDYNKESFFTNKKYGAAPYFFKRIEYNYENELRCAYQRVRFGVQNPDQTYDSKEIGNYISIDIKKLIERVVVSPLMDDWILNLIKEISLKLGYEFLIEKSKLLKVPLF